MRICVLISSYEQSTSVFSEHDPLMDPRPWLEGHNVELHPLHKNTSKDEVAALATQGFDVFINLCDGGEGEDTAGIDVVHALEALHLPFTGASSTSFDPSRDETKQACKAAGILTPRGITTSNADDATSIEKTLHFPMIVKHPRSVGSIGMTKDSGVTTLEALRGELARMINTYGSALVEEFVEGREYTVLVTEPGEDESKARGYIPIEEVFPEGETFKHFDLKWKDDSRITWTPVRDGELAAKLIHAASTLFTALNASGYARCDLRVDAEGRVFVLEINANCGIFYPAYTYGCADVVLVQSEGGHRAFIEHIIHCALRRHQRSST
jgi:D-alanine-D-alanine ligase